MDLIGHEMWTRKRFGAAPLQVIVDSQDDDLITKSLKEIIKGAIIMDPQERLTAQDVLDKLNHVSHLLF